MRLIPLPWTLLAGVLILGGSTAYAYRKGGQHKADEIAAQIVMAQEAQDAALQTAAAEIAKINVQEVTIRQRTEREIVRIPADCIAPDSLLELTNEAITGKPAGDSGMPATDPDGGGDLP